MALKETIKHMRELLSNIETDLVKAEGGNKAASQRVRTGTVALEKLAKVYRKESIQSEKGIEPRGAAKHHAKGKASHKEVASKSKTAAKPKPKTASAQGRPLQVKRPTAKLPKHHR